MSVFELERLFKDLMRRVHLLEVTQPMGFSSVSEGRSRFAGNESILVEGSGKVEGWWIVTGTQRVTGRWEGSGTCDWTGPASFRGKMDITGDALISGNTSVTGRMRIRGETTVESDLRVTNDGRILVGDMTIDPNGGSGRVRFANGGQVWAESNAIKMMIGAHAVSVSNGSVLIASSGYALEVGSAGVKIVGTLPKVTLPGLPPGVMVRRPGGALYETD